MQEPAPMPGTGQQPVSAFSFGPQETITIGQLRIGDFVIKVPSQRGWRGLVINSAVRTIEDKTGWVLKSHRARSKIMVDGKQISFQVQRHRTFSWPDEFDVIVRRPVQPSQDSPFPAR
jgi:hypothetical protein